MRDGSTGGCLNIKQLERWLCVCVLEDCWTPTNSVTEGHRESFFSIPVTNQPKSSAREDMLSL